MLRFAFLIVLALPALASATLVPMVAEAIVPELCPILAVAGDLAAKIAEAASRLKVVFALPEPKLNPATLNPVHQVIGK